MAEQVALIFDGDDTLWKTHYLYEKVKTQAAILLNDAGVEVDRDTFAQKVNEFSVAIGKSQGFTNTRFPRALTEAYRHFSEQQLVDLDEKTLEQLWKLGASVATKPSKLMPHAREILEVLSTEYDCILYTLGEREQQLYRLNSVSLASYFKHVFTFLHKGEPVLRRILSDLNLNPALTWMIGNSAGSDIKPALKLGLNCIWVHTEHWLFDDADIDASKVHEITSLEEVVPIIRAWERERTLRESRVESDLMPRTGG